MLDIPISPKTIIKSTGVSVTRSHNPTASLVFSQRSLGLLLLLSSLHAISVLMVLILNAYHSQFNMLSFDAGLIAFTVTYLLTDLLTEIFGQKLAIKITIRSIFTLLAALLLLQIALYLPPSYLWPNAIQFLRVFNPTPIPLIASILAILLSQLYNIVIYSWVKERIGDEYLWLRNNLSTLIGGLFESTVYVFIAYFMRADGWFLISSIYTLRILITIAGTPAFYLSYWTISSFYPEIQKYDLVEEIRNNGANQISNPKIKTRDLGAYHVAKHQKLTDP